MTHASYEPAYPGDGLSAGEGFGLPEYLSVGAVAALLRVAPATLRSWGRRYGIVPAARTGGGHRRYAPDEVARLRTMQALVDAGITPSEAARRVLGGHADSAVDGSPAELTQGGRPRAVPGPKPAGTSGGRSAARGLDRSVVRLDADGTSGQISDLLLRRGAEETWFGVVAPLLQSIGQRGTTDQDGLEVEHVLTEAMIEAIRGYCGFLPTPERRRPVLLACAPGEAHTLPLQILRAVLTERRIGSIVVGNQVPVGALPTAARRIGARMVFIWRQSADAAAPAGSSWSHRVEGGSLTPGSWLVPDGMLAPSVVGGDGWARVALPPNVRWAPDLRSAIRLLTA